MWLNIPKKFFLISCLTIAIVGFTNYSNSLDNAFHFDDFDNIVNIPAIRSLTNIIGIYKLSDRPLTNYTFAINYFFGKYNVFGFHLFNIVLHILCALLVFVFLNLTLNLPSLKPKYGKHAPWISFFGGLIFVSHPVKVEAVTYITARSEIIVSIFYLLSLIFLILSVNRHEKKRLYERLAIASVFLAMPSKVIAITLPITILLFDYLFIARFSLPHLRTRSKLHAAMFSAILLLLFMVLTHDSNKNAAAGFGNPHLHSPLEHLLTGFRVYLYYFKLMFVPHPSILNFDTYFPISRSFSEIKTALSFLGCSAIILYAFKIIRKNPLAAFFILWYFIILIPTTTIMPIEDVMYERRLYLASLGWWMIAFIVIKRINYKIRFAILAAIVVLFSFWTLQRNAVWRTEGSLWEDTIKKSPLKTRTLVNYGFWFMKNQDLNTAEAKMREALRIDPEATNAWLDLALIYSLRGKYAESEKMFLNLVEREPDYASAFSNLGTVFRKQGKLDDAEKALKKALEIFPDFAEAHGNLGLVYAQKNRIREAIQELELSIKLNPDIPEPHQNLGIIYQKMGEHRKAITEFKQAAALNAIYPAPHYNLGISYLALGMNYEFENEVRILQSLDFNLAHKLRNFKQLSSSLNK